MMVMLVMMLMAAAFALFVMIMMMSMGFFRFFQKGSFHGVLPEGFHDLFLAQKGQVGGNDVCLPIDLPDNLNRFLDFGFAGLIGAGHQNTICVLDLIHVELSKVSAIELTLGAIHHGDAGIHADPITNAFHRRNHIGKLSHTGGFDQDPVWSVGFDGLLQRLGEVPHQAAANTTGNHFGDLDPCILQESAVHTDLAKLIFNQDQLFALKYFTDQPFDKGSLPRTQKSGDYIDFRHFISSLI